MNKKVESGAVTEFDFENTFEQYLVIKCTSSKNIKEIIESIKVGLKADVWEERVKQVRRLGSLVKSLKEVDVIKSHICSLENELQKCVTDLRSQIVRESCICVAYLSLRLGVLFESAVEPFAIALMQLVSNKVTIMSSSGKVALKFVYRNIQSKMLIASIWNTISSSRSTDQRQFSCELLNIVFEEWTRKIVETHMDSLIDCLKRGISDSDLEVRTNARKAFIAFHSRFPVQAESMMESLDTNRRNTLMKELSAVNVNDVTDSVEVIGKKIRSRDQDLSGQSVVIQTTETVPELPQSSLFETAMGQLKSPLTAERIAGLETLGRLMADRSVTFNDDQSYCLMTCFNKCFLENDIKVRGAFLATLAVFVESAMDLAGTESLLIKIVNMRVSPRGNDCGPQLDSIVAAISSRTGAAFLGHCLSILASQSASFTAPLRLAFCELILPRLSSSIYDMDPDTVRNVIGAILPWTMDTSHPQLSKVSHDVLTNLKPIYLHLRGATNIASNRSHSKIPVSPRPSSSDLRRSIMPLGNVSPLVIGKNAKGDLNSMDTDGRSTLTNCDLNQPQFLVRSPSRLQQSHTYIPHISKEDKENNITHVQTHKTDTITYLHPPWMDNITHKLENITHKTDDITQKTNNITQKTNNITQKTNNITQKTDNITQKTDNITQKTDNITQKTDSITQKTDSITQKTDSITHKTDNITNIRTNIMQSQISPSMESSSVNDSVIIQLRGHLIDMEDSQSICKYLCEVSKHAQCPSSQSYLIDHLADLYKALSQFLYHRYSLVRKLSIICLAVLYVHVSEDVLSLVTDAKKDLFYVYLQRVQRGTLVLPSFRLLVINKSYL